MYGAEWRHVNCAICGKGFADDCGDIFCSSSCEREYERQTATENCKHCKEEFKADELYDGLCEDCEYNIEHGEE